MHNSFLRLKFQVLWRLALPPFTAPHSKAAIDVQLAAERERLEMAFLDASASVIELVTQLAAKHGLLSTDALKAVC